MMYKIGLYTLGCKVSQYETEAIAEEFVAHGAEICSFDDVCDAYVINTCTVTAESDRKSRQIIRRAIKRNPDATVAVVGCYSQRDPKALSKIQGVDIIIGTDNKLSVVPLVLRHLECGGDTCISVSSLEGAAFEPMTVKTAPRTRGFVKIEDGCDAKCTYCAISLARGPVRSKPQDEVIAEVEALYQSGTREVVLTGIETGSYGKDLPGDVTLASLIRELDRRRSAERIRLGSLAPELVGREFAEGIKGAKIITSHFHISLQSGSNNVLRGMKRRYTRERALENIERLRKYIPGCQFTADLMVGFPGETDEDFLDTINFVKEARLLDAHVFAYSRREGTPAASYEGQIPEDIKRERSRVLIETKNAVRDEVLEERVRTGDTLNCILETYSDGRYTAHSDEFFEVRVVYPEGHEGDLVKVTPVSHKCGIIYGIVNNY